jgi:hypothetical protein
MFYIRVLFRAQVGRDKATGRMSRDRGAARRLSTGRNPSWGALHLVLQVGDEAAAGVAQVLVEAPVGGLAVVGQVSGAVIGAQHLVENG